MFTNTLLEFIEKFEPSHIAAVFDAPGPTHRHKEYAEYKATRDRMPEDLSTALPYVFSLLEAFRIPVLRVEGWEADDVIGTLALSAESAGMTTYMVTPDKDFAQLVSSKTLLYRPGRAGKPQEILGVKHAKFAFPELVCHDDPSKRRAHTIEKPPPAQVSYGIGDPFIVLVHGYGKPIEEQRAVL